MRSFPIGKIPAHILRKTVFKNLGVPSHGLLLGPGIGEDAAVVRMGNAVAVLSTDPITGALSNIGWLSVHINANDIATRGARPRWYLCSILLPEDSDEYDLRQIMSQVDRACVELEVSVIGGHTEVTPHLKQPIIVGFMVGEVKSGNYFTSEGATASDVLIMTKSAGIEGTAIIATDRAERLKKFLSAKTIRRAQRLYSKISVVDDAMEAVKVGGVEAMHDPTEGGLLCGVWELAEASHLGVRIYPERVPIAAETKTLCKKLGINPFRIMSSGSLLVAAKTSFAARITSRLRRRGIPAAEIGHFTKLGDGRRIINKDGSTDELTPPFPDEVYEVLERLE